MADATGRDRRGLNIAEQDFEDRHARRLDKLGDSTAPAARERRHRDSERDRDRERDKDRDENRNRHKRNRKDGSRERRRHRRDASQESESDGSSEDARDRQGRQRRARDGSEEAERRERSRRHHGRDSAKRRHRHRSSSSSSDHKRRRRRQDSRSRSRSRSPRHRPAPVRSTAPLPSQSASFQTNIDPSKTPPPEKQLPNFRPTGLLATAANLIPNTTISLKYSEPPDARKPPPSAPWRLYIFKGADMLESVELAERSCWLVGREERVVDVLAGHGSVSGQHAVVQFRYTDSKGGGRKGVKPYVIDLESANGTRLNGEKVPASRYVELRDGDVLTFGRSEREYVLQLPPAASSA